MTWFYRQRDCFTGSTPISLFDGVSVYIKDMDKRKHNVLGFSFTENGLIDSVQSHFLYKGKKECLEITLEDGRKIKCTQNHKLLDSKNNWIEVKNIFIKNTRLKVGLSYPIADFQNELLECNNWKIKFGKKDSN